MLREYTNCYVGALSVMLYAHRKPNKVFDESERKLKKLIVNLIVQALGLLVSVS